MSQEGLEEITAIFVASFPEKARRLTTAWDEQDTDSLRTQAHQLAGSAGGYGFPQLSEMAKCVEDYVDQPQAADELQLAFESLVTTLESLSSTR